MSATMKIFEQLTKNRPPPKASGVQREVLSLYRQFLRAAKEKQDSASTLAVIRMKFREKSKIPKTNLEAIEYHLERGYRQLNKFKNPNTSSMKFVSIKREDQ